VLAHDQRLLDRRVQRRIDGELVAAVVDRDQRARDDGYVGVAGLCELQSLSADSQDVTEQYYDLQSRIRNKQTEEARLVRHLEQSTGKLDEILAVEREVSRVREELERMEGKMRVLQDLTALATVTLHADEIKDLLAPGQAFLLNNKHIYSYILPGNPDTPDPYGGTSYYSCKLIFKTRDNRMHVVTIPVENENIVLNPQLADFINIEAILLNIEKLKCDMYDSALVPVALVNKLVSLANHPSSKILQKFAISGMQH